MSRRVSKPKYEAPRTFMMGEIGTSSGGCNPVGGLYHQNSCGPTGQSAVACGMGSGASHGQVCDPSGNLPD